MEKPESGLLSLSSTRGQRGCPDPQRIAQREKRLQGRRLLIEFEQADVIAGEACLEGELLLRQTGGETSFAYFITEHAADANS